MNVANEGRETKSRPGRLAGRSAWNATTLAVSAWGVTGPDTRAQAPDARPTDLSPPSAVLTPHLGKLRPPGAARSRGSDSNVGSQRRAPTFWARASSSAWISNSPSSESLLRAWEAAPRCLRSPFFFLRWAMAARDRSPAAGSVAAAMRAGALGEGGRSLQGRTNGAAGGGSRAYWLLSLGLCGPGSWHTYRRAHITHTHSSD